MSDDKLIKLEGFNGPFINEYLEGMAPNCNDKKFRTLDEARKECLKNNFSTGITLTRSGFYTLRKGKRLLNSDPKNKFKNKEITWVKDPDYVYKRTNVKVKNIFTKGDYVIEEIEIKKNTTYNDDDIYEKVFINKKEYLYNKKNRLVLKLDGEQVGELIRGKMNYC